MRFGFLNFWNIKSKNIVNLKIFFLKTIFNIFFSKFFWEILFFCSNIVFFNFTKVKIYVQVLGTFFAKLKMDFFLSYKKKKYCQLFLRTFFFLKNSLKKKLFTLNFSFFWLFLVFKNFWLAKFKKNLFTFIFNNWFLKQFFFFNCSFINFFSVKLKFKLKYYLYLILKVSFFFFSKVLIFFEKFYFKFLNINCNFIYKKYIKNFFLYTKELVFINQNLWFLKKNLVFNQILKVILFTFLYKQPEILINLLKLVFNTGFNKQNKNLKLIRNILNSFRLFFFNIFSFSLIIKGRFLNNKRTKSWLITKSIMSKKNNLVLYKTYASYCFSNLGILGLKLTLSF